MEVPESERKGKKEQGVVKAISRFGWASLVLCYIKIIEESWPIPHSL